MAKVTTASGATWQQVAEDRQHHRSTTISAISPSLPDTIQSVPLNTLSLAVQFLTPEEIKITESTVEELIPQLASGEIHSTTVTNAFLRRAGLAQLAVRVYTTNLPT